MEKIFEKVATENAITIMTERILDLLTNNTRIMDYVGSIGNIEVITDFANGYVEVKTGDFTITYYISDTPNIIFDKRWKYNSIDLSDFIEILNYNEQVDNIFHTIKNKMFN